MLCILEGIQQIKVWRKAQTEENPGLKWSLFFLDSLFSLPTCPLTSSISKSLLGWSFRQMNTRLLSWALLFLYEGWRASGRNRWQLEQVAKQNRETDVATNSGTSVMHWLPVFHKWKLVSLTSDICISVKASRDAELHCAAWLKKVYSRITEYLNLMSYLTNKAFFFFTIFQLIISWIIIQLVFYILNEHSATHNHEDMKVEIKGPARFVHIENIFKLPHYDFVTRKQKHIGLMKLQ